MSNRVLHVWHDQTLVGRFMRQPSGLTTFEYSDDTNELISLSLPRSGDWKEDAPANFLDGLLPCESGERARLKDILDAASTDPFDLLDATDTTGGYTYTLDAEPPSVSPSSNEVATSQDIEARIQTIATTKHRPWAEDCERHGRVCLAGAQGKFALARHEDTWAWPNASVPSTHIIKPDIREYPESSCVEDATMTLAAHCGLAVPAHNQLDTAIPAYIVSRFDRRMTPNGLAERLHVEDLTQAMGLPKEEKYYVEIGEVVPLLRQADPTDELAYSWLEQIAFNTHVGNSDAHAKNYSIIHEHGEIKLSPIYDALVTGVWESIGTGLSMTVNDKCFPHEVTLDDWRFEAEACGLDPDRVAASVQAICTALDNETHGIAQMLPERLRDPFLKAVSRSHTGIPSIAPSTVRDSIEAARVQAHILQTDQQDHQSIGHSHTEQTL